MTLPVIDIQPLVTGSAGQQAVAQQIHDACTETGFFYISGHGVPPELQARLGALSRDFFTLDLEEKMKIRMALGGRAWRGYFPVGDELTSGKPDQKEGLYFGSELPADHPRVRVGTPLHGTNLFPDKLPAFRDIVLRYMDAVTEVGQHLMRGIALSLNLDPAYFVTHYTLDPLILFRIFHYPAQPPNTHEQWGVGEHTDYGLLTILKQDMNGGLQVRSKQGWSDAPPLPNTFVCNIGDMLDRLTRGYYKSTPHRVLNTSGRNRLSFPLFFDPGFDAKLEPIDIPGQSRNVNEGDERWDGANVHAFEGTYGEYLLGKVSKVFPELGEKNF